MMTYICNCACNRCLSGYCCWAPRETYECITGYNFDTSLHEHYAVVKGFWGNPDWRYETCSCGAIRYYQDGQWGLWVEWPRYEQESL